MTPPKVHDRNVGWMEMDRVHLFTACNVHDEHSGVTYTPFIDAVERAVGLRCTRGDQVEWIYFSPSSTDHGDPQPNVFVYQGPTGKAWNDCACHFYLVMEDT